LGIRARIAAASGHSFWRERQVSTSAAWVAGAVFVIRRGIFDAVGGFDPLYFLYKEEEDLCLQVRRRGHDVRYEPSVVVQHVGSVVAAKSDHMAASLVHFQAKNFRWQWLRRLLERFYLHQVGFAEPWAQRGLTGRLTSLSMTFRPRWARLRLAGASRDDQGLPLVAASAREPADDGVTTRARRTLGYESPREDVQAHVPLSARNILELGCSTGALSAAIKRRQDVEVTGVEIDPMYAVEARKRLDRVVTASVEDFLDSGPHAHSPFDCLIAADVLEHLVDPWAALAASTELLSPGGTVVVSLPNVLYWKALGRLLRDTRWPRDDEGVFDGTHLRWFAREDAVSLLTQAGIDVHTIEPRLHVPERRLPILLRLYRHTPMGPYLPRQYILVGTKIGQRSRPPLPYEPGAPSM
jgi:2-polyprenyl-3-methyl-5-hydroxy-6-metoxy-1,4-benzoquinol methylase